MALKTKLEVLSQEDLTRVHEASLKILRETGIVFPSEEALDLFKKHGAKVENQTVYITEEMVNKALKTVPKKFNMVGRNKKHIVTVGDGLIVQPNVGQVYIQDLDRGRRLANLEDYANIQKLCQASNVIDLVGTIPVDPSDATRNDKYMQMMYEVLKNTDKPLLGFCANTQEIREQLDMIEIALGSSLDEKHYTAVLVDPLSPLGYAPETLETMIEYAKRNQVVFLAPCILAGVSGPISLLGTAVLQNTEILSGLVLLQMVNPGAPMVYSTASSVGYMKTASYAGGAPEAMLINTASLQMALDFYHIPARTMTGITHSKIPDYQAGYETMQSLMMGMFSGAHIAVQSLGILDALMVTSYEKFVMDEEIISRIKRIKEGIDTSDEALAVDEIQRVGAGGNFLVEKSTFENFRSLWTPTLADWDNYDDWHNSGAEDVVTRANRRYKEVLNNAPVSILDNETDKLLKEYMKKARS